MSVLSYNYISLCVSAFFKCNVIQLTAYSCKTFKLLTMIISSDVSWKLTRTWSYIKNINIISSLDTELLPFPFIMLEFYQTWFVPKILQELLPLLNVIISSYLLVLSQIFSRNFFPRTAGPWNSLPIECFPLTYNLNGFKSRINKHLLPAGSS